MDNINIDRNGVIWAAGESVPRRSFLQRITNVK